MRKIAIVNRPLSLALGIILAFVLVFVLNSVLAWTNPTQAPPGGSGVGLIPAGSMIFWAGSSAPSGWLLCNGSSISTSTYPDLFNAIGYTYGGSGGNFNLPEVRGRTLVMKGTNGSIDALGDNEGESVIGNRRPQHAHLVGGFTDPQGTVNERALTGNAGGGYGGTFTAGPTTNRPVDAPAYLVVNCIIKT